MSIAVVWPNWYVDGGPDIAVPLAESERFQAARRHVFSVAKRVDCRASVRIVEPLVKNLVVATLVQNGEYDGVPRILRKIDSVGETANESSPQLPMRHCVPLGAFPRCAEKRP